MLSFGYMSFSRHFEEDIHSNGYGCCSIVCSHPRDISHIISKQIHTYPVGVDFFTDDSIYTHHRSISTDGRNHPEKISPSLYSALGVFLPLITTNCAVLGVALNVVTKEYTFGGVSHMLSLAESVVFAAGTALGFALALIIFAGIREHIDLMEAPKGMRGVPIALITAGILAMAFMGFAGLV